MCCLDRKSKSQSAAKVLEATALIGSQNGQVFYMSIILAETLARHSLPLPLPILKISARMVQPFGRSFDTNDRIRIPLANPYQKLARFARSLLITVQ